MDNVAYSVMPPSDDLVPFENEKGRQYLLFSLDGEVFAMDIVHIREIIDYSPPTEVPMMPAAIRGVINLRGAVVPVIDLAARFGRTPSRVGRRTSIVILELDGAGDDSLQTVGVVVDGVNEVLDIPASDIEPAPSFGVRLPTDFIAGMARVSGRFTVVLDLSRVLALDETGRSAGLCAYAPAA